MSFDPTQVCEIPSLGTTALKDTQRGDDGKREPSPGVNKLNSQHLHVHNQSAKPKPTFACGSESLRSHLFAYSCFSRAGMSFPCLSAPGNPDLGQRRERVRRGSAKQEKQRQGQGRPGWAGPWALDCPLSKGDCGMAQNPVQLLPCFVGHRKLLHLTEPPLSHPLK